MSCCFLSGGEQMDITCYRQDRYMVVFFSLFFVLLFLFEFNISFVVVVVVCFLYCYGCFLCIILTSYVD